MIRNSRRRFPPGAAEKLGHYVYTLYDPRDLEVGRPFYIGKGYSNDRVFDHFTEAADRKRDGRKVKRIREIWDTENDVVIFIHRHGLTEDQALHVEAALIEAFPEALNEVEGHHSLRQGRIFIDDLCSVLTPEEAQIDFSAVVINIRTEWPWVKEKRGTADEYERRLLSATRSAWPVDVVRRSDVRYAISVAEDLVRQVYSIRGWVAANVDARGNPRKSDRKKMFNGDIAPEKSNLVGKAIPRDWFGGGRRFPLRWVSPASTRNLIGISLEGSVG